MASLSFTGLYNLFKERPDWMKASGSLLHGAEFLHSSDLMNNCWEIPEGPELPLGIGLKITKLLSSLLKSLFLDSLERMKLV